MMFINQEKKRGSKTVISLVFHRQSNDLFMIPSFLYWSCIWTSTSGSAACTITSAVTDQTFEGNPVISSSSDAFALSIWHLVNMILYPDRLIKYPECTCSRQPITLQCTRWISFYSCVAMLQPPSDNRFYLYYYCKFKLKHVLIYNYYYYYC